MACECCTGDVARYDSHLCSSPNEQMVTSGYQVPSPCYHAYPPSHTHVSHHRCQHVSTSSQGHSCHPVHSVAHNSKECCHVHSGFSHHEHQHLPVFASPLHISHTAPSVSQQLHYGGGIHNPACHIHQFLTPQPQHSRPFYQSQRQLTPPFLPHFHAGASTPSDPHRTLLQQSPLSSYVQPLPASPEHQPHCQLQFSSPLGEDGMVMSTKLVPSCFVLAHESQQVQGQHFQGNPRNASISTLQQPQRRNKSRLPASETALLHQPTVVVQKLPVSMLPKREAGLTLSATEEPPAYPEREQTQSVTFEEESLGDKRHKRRRVSCEQVDERCAQLIAIGDVKVEKTSRVQVQSRDESNTKMAPRRSSRLRCLIDTDDSQSEQDDGDTESAVVRSFKMRQKKMRVKERCAQQIGGVEVEEAVQDVPAEDEAILRDQAQSRDESNAKVAPRRSSRLRYFIDTDDSQSEQDDGDAQSAVVRSFKMRQKKMRVKERCAQQIGGVEVEEAVQDVPAEDEAILRDQAQSRDESNTKVSPRRSSRLRYFIDTDDSQSEQDDGDVQSAAVRPVKMRQKKMRVKERCAQHIGGVEVEETVQDVPAEDEAILKDALLPRPTGSKTKIPVSVSDIRVQAQRRDESNTKVSPRRSSRLGYFIDTDDSQSEQDIGGTKSAVVSSFKMRHKKEGVKEHCAQQIGGVKVKESVLDVPAEDETIPEDVLLTQPTSARVPACGKDSRKTDKGSVVLSNWYFKVTVVSDSSCLVIVQGTKTDDTSHLLWHSGPIVKRLSCRELATKSGSVYCLKGPLDQAALAEAGINDAEVAQSFRNGFPKNWLQLIEKQALQGKRAVDKTENVAAGGPSLEGRRLRIKSEPKNTKTLDLDLNAASSSSFIVSSLKRSSRGRTIKPSVFNMSPYINLTNEVYSYNWDGSFRGVSPVIDLTLSDDSQRPRKTKRQVKKRSDSEEDSLLAKKDIKQEAQPGDWEDDSPLLTLERSAHLKSPKNYSTDSCSESALPSGRKKRRSGNRCVLPLRRRLKKVVTKTKTTTTYDESVEEGRTGEEEEEEAVGQTGEEEEEEAVAQNGEEEEEEEAVVRVDVKAKQQTRKNAGGAGRRKVAHRLTAPQSGSQYSEWTLGEGEEGEEGIPWSATDIKDLKSVVLAVPAMTENFWERVARRLGTGHSARECSHQYLQLTVKPPRRKHSREKPTKVTTSGPAAITGGVGTMKRKRQIRGALEQMDHGYTDDIFESTPFKKKVKRVQLPELSDEESSVEEDGVESQPIQTPNEAKRRLGAPSSFTPKLCSYLTTPDFKGGMKREAADKVMYKIQKAKKGRMPKQPTKPGGPLGKTKPLLCEQRLRNIRTGESTTLRMFEDSDDSGSDSDPFSDIEEDYRDIISRIH